MANDLRAYVAHRQRSWLPAQRCRCGRDLLGTMTRPLRWLARHGLLSDLVTLTPERWFE